MSNLPSPPKYFCLELMIFLLMSSSNYSMRAPGCIISFSSPKTESSDFLHQNYNFHFNHCTQKADSPIDFMYSTARTPPHTHTYARAFIHTYAS